MLSIIPLVIALSFPAQDAPAKAPAQWTQAELESLSAKIRGDLEKMRGLAFKRPVSVKLADKKGFVEHARKRMEMALTPERAHRDETVAKMLGLIPPDMDLLQAYEDFMKEQVGGFYDPSSDTFYLMETFTGDLAKVILAHELTHALDDQYYDIDGTFKTLRDETDSELAFGSVVEGSGTAAMFQWMMEHIGEMDPASLASAGDLGMQGLDTAPQFIWKPMLAVYLRGQIFLSQSKDSGRREGVRQAFQTLPRSSEQILHPEKYWDEKKRDEPRRIEFDTTKLPAEWKVLGEDTLGELVLALVATPTVERKPLDATNQLAIMSLAFTNEAAEGWGGDRVLLLGKGDERRLVLVTVWDTPEDAREFHAACKSVFASLPATNAALPAGVTADLVGEGSVVLHAHWGRSAAAVTDIAWSEKK
ncbi:MAG: hypothetical protein ACKVWV_16220 [Planctomycetota bacterium]